MASIEVPVGGQWERLVSYANDSVGASGYTKEWSADGSKYRMLRFRGAYQGQSLNLNINGTARCWGGINLTKHDGSGTYKHPSPINNQRYNIHGRGTGFFEGIASSRRTRGAGWMVYLQGFVGMDGAGGWLAAGGDYWRFDGRLWITNNVSSGTGWNFLWGFSSDQSGAVDIAVEGMRG